MPVYNGSAFVAKAIDSILAQTYPRFELIVVDDGSTDLTWKILRIYRKKFPKLVKAYRFKKNQGESKAANYAYEKSSGDYIARMDADDVAHKTRLAKQVKYLEAHERVVALGTQAKVIDKKGKTIGHKKTPLTHEKIYTTFAYFNAMIHPSVMFRRSLLPEHKGLYRSNFESTDDYHTYFELLNWGQFANLPEELISYRIHGANKSLTNLKEKFWTDTRVRFTAMSKMNYRAPILMFPAILIQALMVSVMPEAVLLWLYFFMRGLRNIDIKTGKKAQTFLPEQDKKYRYALN